MHLSRLKLLLTATVVRSAACYGTPLRHPVHASRLRTLPQRLGMSAAFATHEEKHRVIFVLGGPGAGKGTQCARLVDEFSLTHLSAGDLLRQERASDSKDGQMIDEYIKAGKIVPVAVSLGLLKRAMDQAPGSSFLIDGFPRNWDNVKGWDELMADAAEVQCVLFLDCSEEEQERRVLDRGLSSGRTDDNIESARKRFRTYTQETVPVVKHFEESGLLRRIRAEADPDTVYARVKAAIAGDLSGIGIDLETGGGRSDGG